MSIIGISGRIGSGKDTVANIIQYLVNVSNRTGFEASDEKFYLEEYLEGRGLRYWKDKKFAGKLKQIVSILTGIPVEDLEKEEVKNSYLGEEWNRWKYYMLIGAAHYFGTTSTKEEVEETYQTKKELYKDKHDSFKLDVREERLTVRQLLQEMGTEAMRNVIHPNIHCIALFSDYKPTREFNEIHDETIYPNWIISDMRFPNELEAVKKRGGITIRVQRTDHTGQGKLNPHTSETALDDAEFDYYIDNFGTIEELVEKVREVLIKEKII